MTGLDTARLLAAEGVCRRPAVGEVVVTGLETGRLLAAEGRADSLLWERSL